MGSRERLSPLPPVPAPGGKRRVFTLRPAAGSWSRTRGRGRAGGASTALALEGGPGGRTRASPDGLLRAGSPVGPPHAPCVSPSALFLETALGEGKRHPRVCCQALPVASSPPRPPLPLPEPRWAARWRPGPGRLPRWGGQRVALLVSAGRASSASGDPARRETSVCWPPRPSAHLIGTID